MPGWIVPALLIAAVWAVWWHLRRNDAREDEKADAAFQPGPCDRPGSVGQTTPVSPAPFPKPTPPPAPHNDPAPAIQPAHTETLKLAPKYGIPGCTVTITGIDADVVGTGGPMFKQVPDPKEAKPMTQQAATPTPTPPPAGPLAAVVEQTLAEIRSTANVPQVTELVKKAAAGTDSKLIFDIGDELCSSSSKHFNRNIPLALTWLRYAAEHLQYAKAWEDIGDIMLAPEMPAMRHYEAAFEAYDKARDNAIFAQTKYALCLLMGVGCDRDDTAGMIELKAAMDRNDTYFAKPVYLTGRMPRACAHYFLAWSELSDIAIGDEVLLDDMRNYFIRNKRQQAVTGVKPAEARKTAAAGSQTPPDYKKLLDEMIGLGDVKLQVRRIAALVKFELERKKANLPTSTLSMHMIFTGNPGTGKTTVARILGGLFHEVGYLKSGHVVETSAPDLIGQYVGETSQKTIAKLREALGGILFIDEAYAVAGHRTASGGDYGADAIATILKFMEDHRDDFVLIAAGYPKEMEIFVNSNPGLKSRFTEFVKFPNYKPDELELIFVKMAADQKFVLGEDTRADLKKYLTEAVADYGKEFSNARFVRNLFEDAVKNLALRVEDVAAATPDQLCLITAADLAAAYAENKKADDDGDGDGEGSRRIGFIQQS